MLRLTRNARLNDKKVQQLRDKTRELLSGHNPQPSLVHGGKFVCVHSTNLRTVFHFSNSTILNTQIVYFLTIRFMGRE